MDRAADSAVDGALESGVDEAPGPGAARSAGKRRAALVAAGAATIVLGLSVRALGEPAWAGPAGDALYAVMVYVAIAFLLPRKPRPLAALAALAACTAIELFQLTGIPAALASAWTPIRLVFGTTFGLFDLAAYAAGAAAGLAADAVISAAAGKAHSPAAQSRRARPRTGRGA
ncbi:ribosomal maturation YjgA family protein [Arthrobacter mangrovi]|nr:DUF2809 domain-containing protein [Arthrobacter mangrovi]